MRQEFENIVEGDPRWREPDKIYRLDKDFHITREYTKAKYFLRIYPVYSGSGEKSKLVRHDIELGEYRDLTHINAVRYIFPKEWARALLSLVDAAIIDRANLPDDLVGYREVAYDEKDG